MRADLTWASFVVAGLVAVGGLLATLRGVTIPVLVALGLAYVLDPIVDRLERRGWSRTRSILVLGGGLLLSAGGALALVVPATLRQATRLPGYLRDLSARAVPLAESLLGRELPTDVKSIGAELSANAADLASQAGPAVGQFLLKAAGGTASLVGTVGGLALVPLFLFYFLRDFDRLKDDAAELLPAASRAQIRSRFSETDDVLAAFVRGQLTVAAILGTIYATGLTISGVKLGLAIGLLAGLASLVPVAGVVVGVSLTAVAIIVDWHDGSHLTAIGAAITFVVGQGLEGSVITPRIVGEKVGLSPVAVMIAVLAFGELFGLAGMLFAVPLAAVLKVVARVLLGHYRGSGLFRGPA